MSEDPGAGESRFDLDAAAKNRLRLNRVRFEVPVIHSSHSSERDVVAVRVVSDPGRPTGSFNEERVEAWILDDDLLAADRPTSGSGTNSHAATPAQFATGAASRAASVREPTGRRSIVPPRLSNWPVR